MSCDRSQTIDMAEFVSERDDPRFAEFRGHYPFCPECSEEVGRWAELDALLLEGPVPGAGGHPEEARLLAYANGDPRLRDAERASLDAHVSGCGPCRSEVKVLRNFDFAALAPVASEAPSPAWRRLEERFREKLLGVAEAVFGGVPRPVWAPMAIGLVVGALVLLDFEEERPVQLAQEQAPLSVPSALEAEPLEEVAVVAGSTPEVPASPVLGSEVSSEVAVGSEPVTPQIAESVAAPEVMVAAAEEPAPQTPKVTELVAHHDAEESVDEAHPAGAGLLELDLDAGFPERPISYQVAALSPAMSRSLRMGGGVRAARGPEVRLQTLGPDHLGSTSVASPKLYWWLSEPSEASVEISLSDEESIEPALDVTIPGPHAAGIHGLSLAEAGLQLDLGEVYRWQVSLVVDPERRAADLRSSVALSYRLPDAEQAQSLEEGASSDRAHRYAELGYWFDSFALLSRALSQSPEEPRLQAAQTALLEQVGLGEVSGDVTP